MVQEGTPSSKLAHTILQQHISSDISTMNPAYPSYRQTPIVQGPFLFRPLDLQDLDPLTFRISLQCRYKRPVELACVPFKYKQYIVVPHRYIYS